MAVTLINFIYIHDFFAYTQNKWSWDNEKIKNLGSNPIHKIITIVISNALISNIFFLNFSKFNYFTLFWNYFANKSIKLVQENLNFWIYFCIQI